MSFNIGQALIHGAETFLTTGNPIAAGASAVAGGCQPQAPSLPSFDPSQLSSIIGDQPHLISEMNRLSSFAKAVS
jgi:hypothetical protein